MPLDPSPTSDQEAQLLQIELAHCWEHTYTHSTLPYSTELNAHLVITTCSDISHARQTALQITTRLGFNDTEADQVATVVTGLAAHVLCYVGGGQIQLNTATRLHQTGIEIIADDYGLDLSNRVLAVAQELSTTHRLGCGLSGIGQLMDELIVTSTIDQGSHLIARRWSTVSPTL